jgi:hypothetical protein
MRGRRKVMLACALLAAGAASVSIATRTGASDRPALGRLSNIGRPLSLRGPFVQAARAERAALLAVRGRVALYRLETASGSCFGSGTAATIGEIGAAECPQGSFPTARHPVLDLSVYEATTRDRREVALYRAEGVAADGVAEVAFLRPDGRVALHLPVRANVFAATSVPSGPIAGVAALDAKGAEVWRSP